MSVEYKSRNPAAWEEKFGVSFDTLTKSIYGDGWLEKVAQQRPDVFHNGKPHLVIYDMGGVELSIRLYRSRSEYKHQKPVLAGFTLIFYSDSVVFAANINEKLQGSGLGQNFIIHALRALPLMKQEQLVGYASKMGAAFWLRSGAVAYDWPSNSHLAKFDARMDVLLKEPHTQTCGWKEEDRIWLRDINTRKNPADLHLIAARDDLFIDTDHGRMRLDKYLFTDVCFVTFFDIKNSWTINRLRSHLGYDIRTGEVTPLALRPTTPPAPITGRRMRGLNFLKDYFTGPKDSPK